MSSFTIDKIFEIFVAIFEQNVNFEPFFEQNAKLCCNKELLQYAIYLMVKYSALRIPFKININL